MQTSRSMTGSTTLSTAAKTGHVFQESQNIKLWRGCQGAEKPSVAGCVRVLTWR